MKTNLPLIASMALSLLGVLPAKADSTLSVSETSAQQQIGPRNNWLRPFFGGRNLVLFACDVTSKDGANKATGISLRIPNAARMPEQVYVYDGATQLASALPDETARTASLEGFALNIPNGVTKTLTIKADFPPGVADTGTYGEFGQVGIATVTYSTSADATATVVPTKNLVGAEQRLFRPMAANISLAETPTAEEARDNGVLTSIHGNFVIGFTPQGGDLSMPSAGDFVVIAQVGREEVPCQVSVFNGEISRIVNGTTHNIGIRAELPLTIPGAQYQRSGPVSFTVRQVTWRNDAASPTIATAQTWGLDGWRTPKTATLPKSDPEALVTTARMPKVTTKVWNEIRDLSQPDADGFKPQAHSEGGMYIIDGTNPNRNKWLVFPVLVPSGVQGQTKITGQIASVDLIVTPTTMTPVFKAPSDITADSRETLIEYPAQSITRIPTTGQDTVANFEVVLGGLHIQGKALRTGPTTATLQFYWDCEAGFPNSAGQYLDCFDLSAADAEGSTPGKPMRFDLGIGDISKESDSYRLVIKAAPGVFSVQTSRDLINWSPAYFEYCPMYLGPLGDNTATGTIFIPESTLTTPSAPARYFRLAAP